MMKEEVKKWMNEQFAGDADTIATVWEEYLAVTIEKLTAARGSLAAGDFPQLDRLAHTLKGNALMVGDQPLVEAAILLRDAAKASDAEASAKALETIAALDAENRS